jgi:hypothetical protein
MKERITSWKSTAVGIIALIGLIYNGYTSGGFGASDFLLLVFGVGFIASNDTKKTIK